MTRLSEIFPLPIGHDFKQRAFRWASQFEVSCYLDSNGYQGVVGSEHDCLLAVGVASQLLLKTEAGAFNALKNYVDGHQDWLFGYLTYDLKNDVEPRLSSKNHDGIGFPALHFFQPAVVMEIAQQSVTIHSLTDLPQLLYKTINSLPHTVRVGAIRNPQSAIRNRIHKADYLETIQAIRQHILRGDIYEMNFCQEFFAEDCLIDAPAVFQKLNGLGKAPFSGYYRLADRHLLCASPERFLKKIGSKLISQPIKGTRRRGRTVEEDAALRQQLYQSQKDRSENVMIVDLVRNDLARSCRAGSVLVDELYGIYPFEQVLQMISTVSGELLPDVHPVDAIRRSFPMGSMTGAPKVRSMELIEQYEQTKRGLYSGAVGYFTPQGDFDFNVVIRSILYNAADRFLSFQAGGAIVFDSEPESEYEESLLKAQGMFKVLS
ncbi:MAG: anthranilate synthase component I family protein [Saprospiraceae bacterium]|nr:anthranilate synthase component I family protein [Saprospiraceae bacterium]